MRAVTRADVRTSSRRRIQTERNNRKMSVPLFCEPKLLLFYLRAIIPQRPKVFRALLT